MYLSHMHSRYHIPFLLYLQKYQFWSSASLKILLSAMHYYSDEMLDCAYRRWSSLRSWDDSLAWRQLLLLVEKVWRISLLHYMKILISSLLHQDGCVMSVLKWAWSLPPLTMWSLMRQIGETHIDIDWSPSSFIPFPLHAHTHNHGTVLYY